MRRSFRKVVESAGLDPGQWTPRELRRSSVSPLSDAGVPVEHISRLVGHSGTTTTETVYRKQLRPVLLVSWRDGPHLPGGKAGCLVTQLVTQ
jgi:integrase